VEGILRDAAAGEAGADWSNVSQRATVAREQVLRCRGITQHFLRLSRGQTAGIDIVDVQATLNGVARLIDPTARSHSVRVVQAPAFSGVHVYADDAELQHVLINLLLNAIQASRPGGEVHLDVVVGTPTRIRVSDHGCGIAAEHQAHIFEPFFSLRSGGTGLGLFLSLNFARRWGGDLLVTSEVGVGSTFEVVIPTAGTVAARQSA
jgi:two-component system, NtrC family, sensor kinase